MSTTLCVDSSCPRFDLLGCFNLQLFWQLIICLLTFLRMKFTVSPPNSHIPCRFKAVCLFHFSNDARRGKSNRLVRHFNLSRIKEKTTKLKYMCFQNLIVFSKMLILTKNEKEKHQNFLRVKKIIKERKSCILRNNE